MTSVSRASDLAGGNARRVSEEMTDDALEGPVSNCVVCSENTRGVHDRNFVPVRPVKPETFPFAAGRVTTSVRFLAFSRLSFRDRAHQFHIPRF